MDEGIFGTPWSEVVKELIEQWLCSPVDYVAMNNDEIMGISLCSEQFVISRTKNVHKSTLHCFGGIGK